MDRSISFSPLIPDAFLWGFAAFAILLVLFALWKDVRGWWLRGLAAGTLIAALANPVLNQEDREELSNIVFLVEDASESQSIANRPAQIETALQGLREKIGRLDNFEIKPVRIINDVRDQDSGSMVLTELVKAASKVASNRIAGAIIITDGRVHDADFLTSFPAPVHVLQTGAPQDWDRRLTVTAAPAFAIIGEEIRLKLRIDDDGAVPASAGRLAKLSIAIDGNPAAAFDVETNQDLELPLKLTHGGMNVVQFVVATSDTELTDRNNSAVVSINGVRDRLRVLLISGEPYAGGRTWRNLLKSDSAVDLVHFTILRSQSKSNNVPVSELSLIAFPTRELFLEKIDDFDLIIFDRYKRRGMLRASYLQNVAEYARNGGAVLFTTGPDFASVNSLARTDLVDILPALPNLQVIEQGFLPRVSEVGAKHPVTEGLDPNLALDDVDPNWGRWFRLLDTTVRSGNTVMTGIDDKPLLVLDRVGEGRVAMLLSDQAWLWTRGVEGGGPQLELLRRLAHWMMKEPELEEEQLTAAITGNQVFITRRSLKDGAETVTITYPDGRIVKMPLTEVSPGKWSAEFTADTNGLYRMSDGSLDSVFALGAIAPREFQQTLSNASVLEPLVKATGAGIIQLATVAVPDVRLTRTGRTGTGARWLGLTPRDAYRTLEIRQSPLMPTWIWLLLTAMFSIAAWRREGR